jgi:hypothetical protein
MAQRNELARKISAIEASDDYMALADDDSRELYPLVMRSQQTIARMKAAGQDTSEEESRLKMFGGILLWQAAQEYPGRLAALKSQQQQVEKTLADLQATRERIETIMATSIDIQPMLVRLQESGKENQATLARTRPSSSSRDPGSRFPGPPRHSTTSSSDTTRTKSTTGLLSDEATPRCLHGESLVAVRSTSFRSSTW